jgi:HSP20 family protein
MDLVPFQPLRMLSRWPDMWDDQDWSLTTTGSSNLDLFETENEVVVRTNVAGVDAEDIDLTFEDGVLWIKADKVEEKEDEGKTHYAKSSWSYSYKVAIPGKVDATKEPKAEVDNGVLTVTFEKAEVSKPKKLKVTARAKK